MGVDRLFASSGGTWRPKPRRRATYWLIGISVGLFFGVALLKGLSPGARTTTRAIVQNWFALSSEGLLGGRVWELVTYQFLHAGAMHLVFNMLVLFFLGVLYEDLHGPRNLVWTYLVCGAGAGLACFLEGAPVVGASGSIMALLIILAIQIPNQRMLLFFFPVRMKHLALLIVAIDLLQLLGSAQADGVAHWTHLGGALMGFGEAWLAPRYLGPRLKQALRRRQHRREVASMEATLKEERELDRILDKISREGLPALTEQERSFLQKASKKLQDTRHP